MPKTSFFFIKLRICEEKKKPVQLQSGTQETRLLSHYLEAVQISFIFRRSQITLLGCIDSSVRELVEAPHGRFLWVLFYSDYHENGYSQSRVRLAALNGPISCCQQMNKGKKLKIALNRIPFNHEILLGPTLLSLRSSIALSWIGTCKWSVSIHKLFKNDYNCLKSDYGKILRNITVVHLKMRYIKYYKVCILYFVNVSSL